ncbi:hypothetical protein BDN70DRAFT_988445 [Pholiota conissans]|uniref:Uncharacterized protein n=1 Tax=Pholiota conissans TaxID=109636 RepID=A0A9P5ZES3_9AGAR|nr:hypothetical protein BDN70DRAFT_988445 [Pholiota conissans]
MSTPVASAQLDEGCRILTISASMAGSTSFIERLQALSKSESDNVDAAGPQPHPSGVTIAHYTISNRYYTAPVHFAAYELETVYPGLFSLDRGPDYKPPPALIYVWADGEPYVKHVAELSRIMAQGSYDPEVRLAVRIPPTAVLSENRPNIEEAAPKDNEDIDIDSTLMSFGFEYVDATRGHITTKSREVEDTHDDIPSLPRVLDALSTVMWPSMQSSKTASATARSLPGSGATSKQRELEHNSIMEELLSVSGISGISRADAHSSGTQGDHNRSDDEDDADSLFSPYEFNSNGHFPGPSPGLPSQKPWLSEPSSSAAQTPSIQIPRSSRYPHTDGDFASSPKEIVVGSPFGLGVSVFGQADSGARPASIGFEDDFTVFISAPAESEADKSIDVRGWTPLDLSHAGFEAVGNGEETPMATAFADSVVTGDSLGDSKGLTPASAATAFGRAGKGRGRGNLYRSLGSVSDFGADESDRNEYTPLGEESHSEEDTDGAEEWEDSAEEPGEAIDNWEENTEEWEDANDFYDEDDDDDGMPTQQEILATAARIFGGVPVGSVPTTSGGFKKASELPKDLPTTSKSAFSGSTTQDAANISSSSSTRTQTDTTPTPKQSDGHAIDMEQEQDADDSEIGPAGPIDIERVFRSLQGLREEIAGVDNEEERRRMAARVALGFVYGMDLDKMSLGSQDGKVEL